MSERDNELYYKLVKRKDTEGDFYFLRRDSVDVMRYLPRFLAKDPEFLKIQNALSWEHEHLRLKLQDVARQFYIETATWGLSSWERIYEVTPPNGADYSLRRALVKAKMLGTGVMTVEAIKHLVNPFLFQPDADVDELPVPGTFRVLIHSGTDYMSEIRRALAIMAPAHLVYKFGFIIQDLEDNPGENLSDGLSGVINYGYEDIYPYFNVPFRHDGFPFHEGAFRHSGFFLRNGEILHSGVPCSTFQRQSFRVNIDELTLNAKIILYDDTTTLDDDDRRNMYYLHNGILFHGGVLRREGVVLHNGTERRNGIIVQPLTLPLDWIAEFGTRLTLKDQVERTADTPPQARLSLGLRDFVPYGTRLPLLFRDGSIWRSGTQYRAGTFERDSGIFHDGNTHSAWARLGKSAFEWDEYRAKTILSLRDDVSELIVKRNGSAFYNGIYPHGSGVFPIDVGETLNIRQCLKDTVANIEDKSLAAKLSACLSDIVPYGTKPLADHSGKEYRGGTFHRNAERQYDGEMLHNGSVGAAYWHGGKSDLAMDEYSAAVWTGFSDDASREYPARAGAEDRDGGIAHGDNPTPRDAATEFSVRQVFTETPTVADKGGQMQMRINTLHVGGVRRDGRAMHDMSDFTSSLDDGFSVIRKGRSGYYARDGDSERSHDMLAVAI